MTETQIERGAAPRRGPLTGVRVVEFGGMGPGPFAAMMLGDAGADVVRLERPGGFTAVQAVDATLRSRRIVEIDLKSEEGRTAAFEFIRRADILIEGFRPGVMERLGFGPEACRALNPALVYGRMTGWGQTGPLAQTAGHDINYVALAGALHPIGPPDAPPPPPLNLIGDYGGGGMLLAFGLLAALTRSRVTGEGDVVDAAMCDGTALLTTLVQGWRGSGAWRPEREANILDGAAPFYRCYTCADWEYMAVGAIEPKFFAALLDGLGLAKDPLFSDQLDRTLWPAQTTRMAIVFATRTRAEWSQIFDGTDACVTPVLSLEEAPKHPAAVARDAFVALDCDGAQVEAPAPAPRFAAAPGAATQPHRCDMATVLKDWMG